MWTTADVKSSELRCAFCSCDNQNVLEKHHRIPQRFGGTDSDENIVTVCANCHSVLERVFNRDFWRRVKMIEFDAEKTNQQSKLAKAGPGTNSSTNHSQTLKSSQGGDRREYEGLDGLAKKIVDEERLNDIRSNENNIDKDLLLYEFDVSPKDTKLLRKLIKREMVNRNADARYAKSLRKKLRKEERNKLLKSIYKKSDMTQKELAENVGLSRSRVADILSDN